MSFFHRLVSASRVRSLGTKPSVRLTRFHSRDLLSLRDTFLEEMQKEQLLRIIVDHEPAVEEVPRAMEYEGHKILEVKKLSQSDWEIVIQKERIA